MYIITVHGKENEGAYSVQDDEGQHILYLFEEEDDAMRYAMMLEDNESPKMHVIEVEDEVMIKTCEVHDYNYAVITPDDIVVPPTSKHDYI
jgi:precorrin-6B methylase 1